MLKIFNIILLLFIFANKSSAQNDSIVKHKINYKNTITGMYINGNSLTYSFNFNNSLFYKYKSLETSNLILFNFISNNHVVSHRDYDIINDVSYIMKNPQYYILSYLEYENLFSRSIDDRYQYGIGIGDKLTDNLKLSDCFAREYTYYLNGYIRDVYRNSARIKYKFSRKNFNIFTEDFYQPSITNISDFRIKSINTISVPIRKNFNFTLSLVDTYESVIVYNKQRNSLTINLGFTINNF